MRFTVDPAFCSQRERFGLVCSCEDCAHFVPAEQRCNHGYPTDEHRRARLEAGATGGTASFCKEFELA